jgi:hypothetical protein
MATGGNGMTFWATFECAERIAARRIAKKAAQEDKECREKLRKLRKESKTLPQLKKEAERVTNELVRLRDWGKPCITCGTWDTVQWEAGHFKSVGAFPELRYDLSNIHKQCHRCNCNLGGNGVAYAQALPLRIGKAEFDRLNGPNDPARYTKDELLSLIDQRRAEIKRLKKSITR